jgi:ABC-type multidrug transport system ATPase subunit
MFGVFVMVVVSGMVLQIRMVLWTSPILLVFMLFMLAQSAVLTGCLVAYICRGARFANMVMKLVMIVIVFTAPFSVTGPHIPTWGEYSWTMWIKLLPCNTAYRASFELVTACARGRCLELSDLTDAAISKNVSWPTDMIVGVTQPWELNPAQALLSHLGLAVVHLCLGWLLVLWLDSHKYPALAQSGVHGTASQSSTDDSVLAVNGLVHSYDWSSSNKILKGVSFQLGSGTLLGLLGPNGSGKTTTIRCITGEEKPREGTVIINPSAAGTSETSANVGLCPQETVISHDLSVQENLMFLAYVRGSRGEDAVAFVQQILAATRLEEKRDWMPGKLSGGMRRRLSVGCAMVASPACVVLDEPSTGLDPATRRGIWSTIKEIKANGGCCLLTTHMLEEAEHLCTNIVVMKLGTVVAEGTVQKLKDEWGAGYMLKLDCEAGNEGKTKKYIEGLLPKDQCQCSDEKLSQLAFKVLCEEEDLGHLIIKIAKEKAANSILRWGLSQASLEDTYLRIIDDESVKSGQIL